MAPPEKKSRLLGAVLINPPAGSGSASHRHLAVGARLLMCDDLRIANLFNVPTQSVTDLTAAGGSEHDWLESREPLAELIRDADEIVLAWGLGGFSGDARRHFRVQVEWLQEQLVLSGVTHAWMIGDQPRHPSRWHQYVSDRHGRTKGGSFEDRLRQVLHKHSVRDLVLK